MNLVDHFVVDSEARHGGLALFWTSNINTNLVLYYWSHIEANVLDCDNRPIRRFVGIYGNPILNEDWKTWDLTIVFVIKIICHFLLVEIEMKFVPHLKRLEALFDIKSIWIIFLILFILMVLSIWGF